MNERLRQEIKELEEAIELKRKSIKEQEKRIGDILKFRKATRAYIV